MVGFEVLDWQSDLVEVVIGVVGVGVLSDFIHSFLKSNL